MEEIYEILNGLRPEFDYHNSDNFIEDGLLDSFDRITLITELEEKFNIRIDALDIVPENFYNIKAIAELVAKNGRAV